MNKIWIKNIGHCIPENIVTNKDLIDKYNIRMKPGWVEKIIGIKERRWASDNHAASDLAVESTKSLNLTDFNGAIFLSTISGDYSTPSTSSIIKRKLGLKDSLPCIDINAACAGQIFALEAAYHRLLATSETETLVMASEVRSRFLNKQDRRTVFLFSDAACSIHLVKEENPPGEIEWITTKTMASDEYEILVPGGGSVSPFSQEVLDKNDHCITMTDGQKIVDVTTNQLITSINDSINNNNQTLDDFDHFIFHQGNGNLIRAICDKAGIPQEKAHINFEKFGNSSSASMGVSLSHAHSQGKLKKGDRILLMAMGAGYHLGMISVKWGLS